MRKLASLVIFGILVSGLVVFAQDDETDKKGGITQYESLGGGQYLTDEGKAVELEDLGEGAYMTDEGKIMQTEDMGGGAYMTDKGDIIQVDEDERKGL
jgi:hypothetical protein